MELEAEGARKYGTRDVLMSSDALAWRGLSAGLRRHPRGELPPFRPSHLEIGIAVGCHADCVVARKGDGLGQSTRVEPGIAWLCPAGVLEEDIRISAWHDVLHVYLPAARFAEHAEARGGTEIGPDSVRYLGGLHDEVLRRAAGLLIAEMKAPSSTGQMLVESVASAITAQIVEHYAGNVRCSGAGRSRQVLGEQRLRRVLQYMAEHLEVEIGLAELASVAGLSVFHFARMFLQTMGMPPHRYLSRLRLERAKTLLAAGKLPLADIALACCFSNQSNFSRAFRRATGTSPLRYRREAP